MDEYTTARPIEILLVDDDPGDVDLMQEVLEMAKVRLSLNVVENGVQAMEFLLKKANYSDVPRPDLILLDLNMPKKDGWETLDEIKAHEDLRSIPVVILTSSSSDRDIAKTYNSGASCYITKPVGLQQFQTVVEAIESFWFTVVRFPPKD